MDESDEGAPESQVQATAPTTFTIDELAARSGVPSRTIRYYQSEGALPPPERRGRVAMYDEDHLERLQLISELQGRGLSLGLIRDLVQRTSAESLSVVEWLGLTDSLAVPWLDDRPADLSETELASHLGDTGLEILDGLVAADIVVRQPDRSFHVPVPALLDMIRELDGAGVDPDTSLEAAIVIRRHLAAGVDEVVHLLMRRAGQGFARHLDPVDLTRAIDVFRPIATHAVTLLFEQEVERSLRSVGWPPS
jgi:DNA-binding transcriptional MerR regulator